MGGILTFNAGEVRRLVEHAKASPDKRPSYEDLFEPSYHFGGKVKEREDGWPDQSNLDKSKMPVALHLVGDMGVYLMSAGLPALLVEEGKPGNVVAYAKESNPRAEGQFDDWYSAKRTILGGDDCVITLPITMFESVLSVLQDHEELKVKVTANHIRVLEPNPRKQ